MCCPCTFELCGMGSLLCTMSVNMSATLVLYMFVCVLVTMYTHIIKQAYITVSAI